MTALAADVEAARTGPDLYIQNEEELNSSGDMVNSGETFEGKTVVLRQSYVDRKLDADKTGVQRRRLYGRFEAV